MKKIIAILLILCMLFAFAGCAAGGNDDTKAPVSSSIPADDLDDLDDEEIEKKEFPTLEGTDEYVVVRRKGKDFEVKDITEIKNHRVGYVRFSDSELIALYYCDEENTAGHGTDQDAFSDLVSDRVDIVICRKMSAEAKDNIEIILDPITMIELD